MPSPKKVTSNTLSNLLEFGYFPDKLPIGFNTKAFAKVVLSTKTHPFNDNDRKKPTTELLKYDVSNRGTKRRIFSIPNPIWFYSLAETITNGWDAISTRLNKGNISLSRPVFDERFHQENPRRRAFIPEFSYDHMNTCRLDVCSKSRYILKTDISRFYSSIYTHSLAWSIHGKDAAKSDKQNKSLLGNKLDKAAQYAQGGQTIGLPIGPDTSYILAELILSDIDEKIKDRGWFGYRRVDDMFFGFKTRSEAEAALSELRKILRDTVELSLNEDKTEILELPIQINDAWIYSLRNFYFPEKRKIHNKLIEYFDLMIGLYRQNPLQNVLNYGIKRLANEDLSELITAEDWDLIQKFLFQCLNIDTTSTIQVISVLVKLEEKGFAIDQKRLALALNDHLMHLCSIGHISELIWTLWAAIYWKCTLHPDVLSLLHKITNSFVVLLLLYAQDLNLTDKKIDISSWAKYASKGQLEGDEWLLSYESFVHDWHLDVKNKNYVKQHEYFNFLHKSGVSFFDAQSFQEAPMLDVDDFYIPELNSPSFAIPTRKNSPTKIDNDDIPF